MVMRSGSMAMRSARYSNAVWRYGYAVCQSAAENKVDGNRRMLGDKRIL